MPSKAGHSTLKPEPKLGKPDRQLDAGLLLACTVPIAEGHGQSAEQN
jgi:hypothetical protein